MGRPGVLLTGGEHQDVARRPTRFEQQVDRLLGGVEGPVRRSRDQLYLRYGRSGGPGGLGLPGGALRALRPAARASRDRDPDDRDAVLTRSAARGRGADRVQDEGSARYGRW